MMIGLAIGAAAILGIAAARRAHWRHACAHGYGPPPWAWHGHHRRGPWGWHGDHGHHHRGGHRTWLWGILERLDLTPAQEKLVRTELDQIVERVRTLRGEGKAARADLGRAVAGETFDRAALDAMFERHDVALVELRAAIVGALGRIHEALDSRQREALSEVLTGGLFRGMGFGGPYRV
jgi:Spy/CpxP family protein refolding chaperone